MITTARIRFTALLCMLSGAAAAENLNLKPGLWELTSSTQIRGTPPISAAQKAQMEQQMAKMPPEQRAKIEAAIKGSQSGMATPAVKRACISKEDLSKPLDFGGGRGEGVCKRTVVKSTSTNQEIRVECTDGTKKSGTTVRIAAASPEAWTGTMEASISDTGGASEMKATTSGKWLSSDCGNAKPLIGK